MQNLENAAKKSAASLLRDIKSVGDDKTAKLNRYLENVGKVVMISIADIHTDDNIRKRIDEDSNSFRALVESIKKYGVMENAVVELHVEGDDYKLVCVAGHRRILAATQNGIQRIACLLKKYEGEGSRVGAALSENLNREDLHAIDVADGYATLTKNGWDVEQLAKFYGRDQRTVQHYMKLSSWPQDVKELVRTHSNIFSTRVLLREFAYKSVVSDDELRNRIKEKIRLSQTKDAGPSRRIQMKEKLDEYFKEKKSLPSETRTAIIDALKYLKLI